MAELNDEEVTSRSMEDFRKFIVSLNLSNNWFPLNYYLVDTTQLDELGCFSQLKSLTINNCGLKNLPSSLTKLKYLRKLTLNRNDLRSFKDRIKECGELQWIVARRNRLTSEGVCATNLCKLPNLAVLDLSHNNLLFIPKDFSMISNLTVLNLSHNNIRMIPKILFSTFIDLLFLDIGDNCLETIPDTLQLLKKLKTLSLKNNSTLSGEHLGVLVYLRSLQILNISNTDRCLGGIPDLRHLANLYSLDISRNSLANIPAHLYGLARLKILNLSGNCLSSLSSTELGNKYWRTIEILNLSRNRISALPNVLFNCLTSCRYLYLNANKLDFEGLPIGFDKMINLQYLSISGNKLQTLPESLSRCSKLKRLSISQNPIIRYPQSIHNLRNQGCIITNDANTSDEQIISKLNFCVSASSLFKNGLVERNEYSPIIYHNNSLQQHTFANDDGLLDLSTDELKCWYVDNFNPKPLKLPHVLYSGECYIFLKSSICKPESSTDESILIEMPRHDIHIWIGKDAPVDKLGSVAVYAIQLRREITNSDNIKQLPLVRRCQTFRHDEGSESNEFWQLFEHKISVKSGCLTASSMYTISKMEFCICSENCTGPICRQMYLINYVNGARQKGRLWALRVPVAQQYLQKQSSIMIRLKIKNQKKSPVILWFGKQVSDAKRAKVRLFIEQYCKEELIHEIVEIIDIFEGYEPKSFWLINFRNYDQNNYTRLVRRLESMSLSDIIYYTVLIRNCEIHLEQPDERKTCHSTIHQLSHNSVYIIDCWTTLYVWLGRQSNQIERNAAIKLCSELKSLLPRQVKDDTVISIQHDGLEDFVLRQILPKSQTNCINPGKGDGDSGGSSHQTIDTSAQNTGPGSNSQSAHLVLQDIFQPKFAIGHHQSTKLLNDCCNQTPDEQKLFASIVINAMELSSFREPRIMSKAEIGKFYSNACYVYIVNKFDHQQNCTTLVYFWKGRLVKTNKSWYIFNAHLKSRIQQLFGAFEMNKISQQQEPPEFRDLFVDQYMIIYLPDCQTKETRYFQISVHSKLSMTLEIEKIEALCPMCIYIVFAKLSKSAAVVYVWQSDRVNDADICTAEKIANTLFPNPEYAVQRIQQGCEPYDFFWQSIGGRKQVSTISLMPKRLFHCSNSKGYFEIKESYQKDFCQDSLLDGNVSFLDDGAGTLFVWISDTASQSLILRSVRAAQLYAGRQSPSGLSKQLSVKHDQLSAGDREIDVDLKTIRFIGTGKEPMEFRRCFFNWFCTEEQ